MDMKDRLKELESLMQKGHCMNSVSDVHNTVGNAKNLMKVWFYYAKQCVMKGFPPPEYVRDNFTFEERAEAGAFVGVTGGITPQMFNAFFGDCKVYFNVSGYNIIKCWVLRNSEINVIADQFSRVHIDCFDQSRVSVEIIGGAKAVINQYGDATVIIQGNYTNVLLINHDSITYK